MGVSPADSPCGYLLRGVAASLEAGNHRPPVIPRVAAVAGLRRGPAIALGPIGDLLLLGLAIGRIGEHPVAARGAGAAAAKGELARRNRSPVGAGIGRGGIGGGRRRARIIVRAARGRSRNGHGRRIGGYIAIGLRAPRVVGVVVVVVGDVVPPVGVTVERQRGEEPGEAGAIVGARPVAPAPVATAPVSVTVAVIAMSVFAMSVPTMTVPAMAVSAGNVAAPAVTVARLAIA